jgi:hypothetical protein
VLRRKVIPRHKWGAAPAKGFLGTMSSTKDGMFVHHTVSGAPRTKSGERAEMRNLQQIAFSRSFSDISYSFIVFPSGRVYEGRGVGVEGAHTIGFNDTAYGVAAAGNYETAKPTRRMVRSFRWLRREHLKLGNKPLRPHSAVSQTACPGKYLFLRLGDI